MTLAQVFSCEFSEISKNTFSHRTPLLAASVLNILLFPELTSNLKFYYRPGVFSDFLQTFSEIIMRVAFLEFRGNYLVVTELI